MNLTLHDINTHDKLYPSKVVPMPPRYYMDSRNFCATCGAEHLEPVPLPATETPLLVKLTWAAMGFAFAFVCMFACTAVWVQK